MWSRSLVRWCCVVVGLHGVRAGPAPTIVAAGDVGIVAHSHCLCSALLDWDDGDAVWLRVAVSWW